MDKLMEAAVQAREFFRSVGAEETKLSGNDAVLMGELEKRLERVLKEGARYEGRYVREGARGGPFSARVYMRSGKFHGREGELEVELMQVHREEDGSISANVAPISVNHGRNYLLIPGDRALGEGGARDAGSEGRPRVGGRQGQGRFPSTRSPSATRSGYGTAAPSRARWTTSGGCARR